jgi:hypothetical protein
MSDWNSIFGQTAPGLLEGALQMGHQLGESEYHWEVSKYFLGWGVPVYLAALTNALGEEEASALVPDFLRELEAAIHAHSAEDDQFPEDEFIDLVESIRQQKVWLAEVAGGEANDADAPSVAVSSHRPGLKRRKPGEEPLEFRIGEAAHNIVKVAFTVSRDQFSPETVGEAATWILAGGSSAFLKGLEVGMGEEEAERSKPSFFSHLHHELREQYEEIEGYPLNHYLEIAGSIARKWLRLNETSPPEEE